MAGEVGNLRLPVAGVDHGPGRKQNDGGLAAAVHVVGDSHPIALHMAGPVWVARSGLLVHGLTVNALGGPFHLILEAGPPAQRLEVDDDDVPAAGLNPAKLTQRAQGRRHPGARSPGPCAQLLLGQR